MGVGLSRKLRGYLAYLDQCDREVAKAEHVIRKLPGARRRAMAADIAELARMKRELARRRFICERFGELTLH